MSLAQKYIKNMEKLVDMIIRPTRYIPHRGHYSVRDLGPKYFVYRNSYFIRNDFTLKNPRGLNLKCSLYSPNDGSSQCIVYCHGSQGNRLDATESLFLLLEYRISVCSFDFAGSGQSEGSFISLGYYEKEDIRAVTSFLRKQGMSQIGLWGRSMGAVASLMYAAEDRNLAFVVSDSAFVSLNDLLTCNIGSYVHFDMLVNFVMNRLKTKIHEQTGIQIEDICPIEYVGQIKCPVMYLHGTNDSLIPCFHSELLHKATKDSSLHKTEGRHNGVRGKDTYSAIGNFVIELMLDDPFQEFSTSAQSPSIESTWTPFVKGKHARNQTQMVPNWSLPFSTFQKALQELKGRADKD